MLESDRVSGSRDLPGHANISQTSTYLQSSAKSLGLAIEKKEAHERQLEEARTKQKEEEEKEEAREAPPPPVLSLGPERIQ